MKRLQVIVLSCLCNAVIAGDMGTSRLNQSGYYLGFGGGYTAANLSANTNLSMTALSGVPPLGLFVGDEYDNSHSANAIFPKVQAGFLQSFTSSPWLWGVELVAQYLNLNLKGDANQPLRLINQPVNTTNDISTASLTLKLKDNFMIPAFIGHSWNNSFMFLGLGPSVLRTQLVAKQVTDSLSGNYIGTITNFSATKWVVGGALEAGVAYYFNPTWFLRLDYTYLFTGHYDTHYSNEYSSSINHGLNDGRLGFEGLQTLNIHEAALTINKLF